jgi:hypothetical protein
MANYTIAQLKSVGIAPATASFASGPSQNVILEYFFDGVKRSTATSDTVDIFEIPAYAGFGVDSAAVTVAAAGTASCTIGVTLGAAAAAGTAVTSLTAWAADAAAGTKLVKLATGAQSIISTTTSNFVKLQFSTAAAGTGKYRVRVFGRLLEAPSAALAG